MQAKSSDSPRSIAAGDPYVRRSANPASCLPWQVRRNRPDQTFEVVSEHATEREAAATIGPAPAFGDWFAGIYASPENPTKYGMYVRTVRVPHGRMNPGTFYELTDGHGKFWQCPVESTVRHGAKRPTDAQVETEAEAARHPRPTHVELLREELREAEAEIERLRAAANDELTTVIDRGEPEERFAIPPNPDPLVLAREIKRIDALGGRRDKDETARLLYNAADVCHDWDKARRGGGAEVRMNEARAMARIVDGWIDEMFPSQEACDAAERMGE